MKNVFIVERLAVLKPLYPNKAAASQLLSPNTVL